MTHYIKIIGCGYIGKKIAGILKDKNINAACFVNSDASISHCVSEGFQVVKFDLDKKTLELDKNTIISFEKSVMVYLVPPPAKGETDSRMQNFIALLSALNYPPEKILLISTTGVYGNCNGEWIDEQRKENPQVDRARRRLSAESQLKKYCATLQVPLIIFRVPGIYAADKLPLKRISSGEPIVNAQDSGFTNRIHALDLARFCVEGLLENVVTTENAWAENAGSNNTGANNARLNNVCSEIFNCCDGQPSTMNDYFMKVADAVKLPRPKEISLQQARQQLSAGMLSYLAESKRISNKKLLRYFKTEFKYPDLLAGLKSLDKKDQGT